MKGLDFAPKWPRNERKLPLRCLPAPSINGPSARKVLWLNSNPRGYLSHVLY